MTAPKIGDRVRVTYEGSWTAARSDVGSVLIQMDGPGVSLWSVPGLAIVEVLPPPAPSWANESGAVVLDKDGTAWQNTMTGWLCVRAAQSRGAQIPLDFASLEDTWGPLRLLYDPSARS